MVRDTITGIDTATAQAGYTPDPPDRVGDVTPFLTDDDSGGVFKQVVAPNQAYPTTRPEPA